MQRTDGVRSGGQSCDIWRAYAQLIRYPSILRVLCMMIIMHLAVCLW